MKIPRIIHQIWLGPKSDSSEESLSLPSVMDTWRHNWSRLNPHWQVWLWGEIMTNKGLKLATSRNVLYGGRLCPVVSPLPSQDDFLCRACHISQRSNIWRYLVVQQFGGLYVDTDVEPCRPIEEVVIDHAAFAAVRIGSAPLTVVESGFFGATANHPWISDVVRSLSLKEPERSLSMGVELLTEVTRRHPEVSHLPTEQVVFDPPTDWAQARREARVPTCDEGARKYPGAFAVHHWSSLWHKDGFEISSKGDRR